VTGQFLLGETEDAATDDDALAKILWMRIIRNVAQEGDDPGQEAQRGSRMIALPIVD